MRKGVTMVENNQNVKDVTVSIIVNVTQDIYIRSTNKM